MQGWQGARVRRRGAFRGDGRSPLKDEWGGGSGSEWDRWLESMAKEMMTEGEVTTTNKPQIN